MMAGEVQNMAVESKSLKTKTTKAERRALQEAQRAIKASARDRNRGAINTSNGASSKSSNQVPKKKDTDSERCSATVYKGRKLNIPPAKMQFDNKCQPGNFENHSAINQTDHGNKVGLFCHLPRYDNENQLLALDSKSFQPDQIHPAIYKVGLQCLAGDVFSENECSVAFLCAFRDFVRDYSMPLEKDFARDLGAKISNFISFFELCRPLSVSTENAARFVKNQIANLPSNVTQSETKFSLCSCIDSFINNKINLAGETIVDYASSEVQDGDVLLIYASTAFELMLLHAHECGKQFRVVIVGAHPRFEGKGLIRRLAAKGMECTYTHISAISYIMHEVTKVVLEAASVLSNGNVYARIGTACVAMVAHAFGVPVIVCCETYKFHKRAQLDSICINELGDPLSLLKVTGKKDNNYLDNSCKDDNMQLLNLMYDVTPADYITKIVSEYGIVPPTDAPIIVHDFVRKNL